MERATRRRLAAISSLDGMTKMPTPIEETSSDVCASVSMGRTNQEFEKKTKMIRQQQTKLFYSLVVVAVARGIFGRDVRQCEASSSGPSTSTMKNTKNSLAAAVDVDVCGNTAGMARPSSRHCRRRCHWVNGPSLPNFSCSLLQAQVDHG